MIEIVHLVDDCSMGGVTAALKNFDDPRLRVIARSKTLVVNPHRILAPRLESEIIVVHFTASWRKLPFLMSLRLVNPEACIILEEHTYTQGFEQWNAPNQARFHQMLNCAYACVDEVVAVSENQAAWLSNIAPKAIVSAIPQSRELDIFKAVQPLRKAGDASIIFGAIGRFHEQKGFDNLITAFRTPALAQARLSIAGKGAEETKLKELAAGASNIEFIGPVYDLCAFYRQVDCVVVPSRWEAFGLVASEAMAAGKLVIASDVDGLTEQVRGFGVLTSSSDPCALREAMTSAAKLNHDEVLALGELSRKAALRRYDDMIAQWERLFLKAYDTRRPRRASSAAALTPMPIRIRPGQ